LSPRELLEVSQIHSVAGLLERGTLSHRRPFRAPHHSASMPAMVGGGSRALPGEVSLAHHGVLFLDELPEFPGVVLEALRQPLENGEAVIARANRHVRYPAQFQLVAAMNPCRCGGGSGAGACRRPGKCAAEYQSRLSGPFLDRIDLFIEVEAVTATDLALARPGEATAPVAARVAAARGLAVDRLAEAPAPGARAANADLSGDRLERFAAPDGPGRDLMARAAEQLRLSARGYNRVLKVARTIADLDGVTGVRRVHVAEALSYRSRPPGANLGTESESPPRAARPRVPVEVLRGSEM
jgi:magnesium chelatase family protein